ncbi:MAG: class I SAM-dependent methyltransferase [Synergistaceae bacterium]|nr:class I SAM-dependent methyltransferase [Synergistaceae bacterium]
MGLFKKFLNQTRKPEGFLGRLMLNGMSFGHARIADWAMSMLNIPEPSEIIELGCGNGRDARELLKKYSSARLTALDYSPLSVEKTKINNKSMIKAGRLEVIEGNVSDLKFEPGKFELATAFETIYFWPGLGHCFEEVLKVLKSGGYFMIVTESDGLDEITQWFKKRIDGMNTYTSQEISDALKAAGFSDVQVNHNKSHPWLMVLARK